MQYCFVNFGEGKSWSIYKFLEETLIFIIVRHVNDRRLILKLGIKYSKFQFQY